MNAFIQHFAFEFRTGIRNKTLLLLNYLFPLGFYLMMGFIMAEINPIFQDVLVPAMTTFAILTATLLGIPDPLVNARERGIYRSYKIAGVPTFSILLISIMTTMVHLAIMGLIIASTAPLLFDAPSPVNWINFTVVFISLAFASAGLGVLIGVISSSSRITVLWSQAVFLPSMLIGGLMFPFSLLPTAAQKIALMLPATHAMNAFNGLAMNSGSDFNPWISVWILLLGGVAALGLAVYLFKWDNQNTNHRTRTFLAILALMPYVMGLLIA
ncbi:MAG: ABC transporter permease [Chloroflexota bacterium]